MSCHVSLVMSEGIKGKTIEPITFISELASITTVGQECIRMGMDWIQIDHENSSMQ